MNLSDLLCSEVIDSNGTHLGTVADVRVVQDGRLLLPFGAAFRIESLLVGDRGIGARLGYDRHGIRGPWILRVIFARLERRSRAIPWSDVIDWNGQVVRVHAESALTED
jgi:hypothetical protein